MTQTVICLGAQRVRAFSFGPSRRSPTAKASPSSSRSGSAPRVPREARRRHLTGLLRRDGVKTASSGAADPSQQQRAGFHVPGANLVYGPDDAPHDDIAPALPHRDYLLPNDEQVVGLTGAATIEDGSLRGVTSVVPRVRWLSPPNG